MQVSVLGNAASHATALRELFQWADEVDCAVAWATAEEGAASHWLSIDSDKIRRAVIGVKFSGTEPWVLWRLWERDRLRIGRSKGTFHPKLYIGMKGKRVRAIVGSANFTSTAFSTNVELSVLLEGAETEAPLQDLARFFSAHWKKGAKVDEPWLLRYEVANQAARKTTPPRTPLLPGESLEVTSVDSLQMPWSAYYETLHNQEGRLDGIIRVFPREKSYSAELERARSAFREQPRFAKMPLDQRRMLMGLPGYSTGLLGSMGRAIQARELVTTAPQEIGKYLDRVPLERKISLDLARTVVHGLMNIPGVKLAVATRLLSVKRPDVFVSVNKGSKPKLANLLGSKPVTTAQQYIDLLEVIWGLDWHRAAPPVERGQRIAWRRRAALLDSILYEVVE